MVPWPIRWVTDLPPNAKLREMQQNTHGLVQLIRYATPHVPEQTPMPSPKVLPQHLPPKAINVDAPASFVTQHGDITAATSGSP